jgi:N-glycosylase/DNA lyase
MKTWSHVYSGVNMPKNVLERKSTESLRIKNDRNEDSISSHLIKRIYGLKREEILQRLKEFKKLWLKGKDEEIFEELAFCILTPQSKAKVCCEAIEKLKEQGVLSRGSNKEIRERIKDVRFKNKKADYLVKARNFFSKNGRVCIKPFLSQFKDTHACREWLVKNIKGLGYKEASHFLRNIGFGEKIAILDRHIMKNLKDLKIIEEVPESLSKAKYLAIEEKMAAFSKEIHIPLSHLDLILWYKETGEILK